jgi:tetratricopeptide (TPR) repeat protein
MKRLYSILTLLLIYAEFLSAQVTLKIQAPSVTEVGRRIRVSYVANTQDVEDIQVGEFPGFNVVYGPSTSSSSSFSIINGKTTQSSSLTFTYTLVATEEGKFTLPAATIKVGGKSYKSGSAVIEVLPSSSNAQGNTQQSQSGRQQNNNASRQRGQVGASDIGSNELYMTVTASKKKIYEQEAVLLTYKLYTLVTVHQIAGEMPQLDGFHVQEVDSKAQMSLKYERVNGRTYGTAVWRQYVLFPQKTGKLKVPSITFDSQIEIQNTSMDPFDVFFGGGSLTQLVKKSINTPAIEIEVLPLPTPKPANFAGAVGKYTISGQLTPEQVNANDAATLRLIVSGQGNMKLMKAPKVNFPQDFEIYDPKVSDKTTNTSLGAKGNVVYDYVVVPRHGGKFTISPVEFCYFDPEVQSYKTLKTDSFTIAVAKSKTKGSSNYHEQEDLKILNNDIRYIKLGKVDSSASDTMFFGSMSYWMYYIVSSGVFVLLLLLFNRQIKKSKDISGMRVQKASKAATKRLKTAAKLMKQHQSEAFFDEVMKALLGYAGDKLNIQNSDLNKENVSASLQSVGVQQNLVDAYMNIISECEFARFAPGDPDATMEKIYSSASDVINELDSAIKKKKNKQDSNMKRYIIVLACVFSFTLNGFAVNDSLKVQADSAYSREHYDKAIKLYEKLAKSTPDYKVYYNLGCSYYRIDNISKSVLWLERASRLNPSDEDVQFNLALVRNKTIDRITPKHEMIFVTLFKKIVNLFSLESWSIVNISLFILTFVFISLFFFSNVLSLRKVGLFMSALCIILCIMGNICAYQQRSLAMNHTSGIIMSPAVTVKSTPTESGSDLFVIHEGTRVEIRDSSMKNWLEIQIADGKIGWIPKNSLELI